MTNEQQIAAVAEEFARVLGDWLSPEQFAEMTRLNKTEEYTHNICASHNFCDANMAMDEAMKKVLGREPNIGGDNEDSEDDIDLWNAAWNEARRLYI